MDSDTKRIVLDVGKGSQDAKPTIASVAFCESSASLQVGELTIHIPWTELASWQAWVANAIEERA